MALALPLVFAVIPILIALYALRVSLRAEKYARAQVELMNEQERKREREQATQDEWSAKFDAAASAVQKLGPHWMQANGSQTNAYGLAFPAELRERIERYLIEERSSRGTFRARQIDASQFRLPPIQDTITQVLDCANKFRQNWPDEAKKLRL
jgi:Arc/MetJ family transcription regulator